MLDRYYSTDELARAIKKALRPNDIKDMTPEQLRDLIDELEEAERNRKSTRQAILLFIAVILAPVFLSFYFFP